MFYNYHPIASSLTEIAFCTLTRGRGRSGSNNVPRIVSSGTACLIACVHKFKKKLKSFRTQIQSANKISRTHRASRMHHSSQRWFTAAYNNLWRRRPRFRYIGDGEWTEVNHIPACASPHYQALGVNHFGLLPDLGWNHFGWLLSPFLQISLQLVLTSAEQRCIPLHCVRSRVWDLRYAVWGGGAERRCDFCCWGRDGRWICGGFAEWSGGKGAHALQGFEGCLCAGYVFSQSPLLSFEAPPPVFE